MRRLTFVDYRCARWKGFKLPFHIVFDVETKSFSHAETRAEELVEVESGKKKSSKEKIRRLVLNSYAITVYADYLPSIESLIKP